MNEEFVKEIQNMLRSKGYVPNIDGLRNIDGIIEFGLERCDGYMEWFPLCMASEIVEDYVKRAVKMGLSIR